MKKFFATFLFSALFAGMAVAQDAPTVITKPAAGETINLYRTTTGFESIYYYGVPHQSTGDWHRLVFGDDGAVYLENPLNSLYTKTWIKGKRTEGDTISFQLPQAIYAEEDFSTGDYKYGYLYRIHPATKDGKQTYMPNEGEANQVLKYVWRNDSLVMVLGREEMIGMCRETGAWTSYAEGTYDEEKNALSTKGILMIHKSLEDDRSTHIFDVYRYALINQWDKKLAAPMPPKLTAYQPYDPNPWGGPGGLQFTLSYYSADFNYLDPSHLYYNLYIDGELFTFKPDTYKSLTEEMTDVPYAFSDQYHFYKYDENSRAIYFYKDAKEKVGMEAVYIDGDQRLRSGITEYVVSDTGLKPATTKRIERVEFYDLSGRSVSCPERGIYVQTTIYTDGSKVSQKIVK